LRFNCFRGFGLGLGFSIGGIIITVSIVVNLVLHFVHWRDRVLPSGISLGFSGNTFSSLDEHLGQVSIM